MQAAVDQGIPVIAYDRLIENEKAFYITFDNPLVGQLMAEEIIKVVPKGNYVIIKGNSADANSDFLRSGIEKVIGASVTSGDIKIVGEDYTDNWDAAIAQTTMEQFLTAENNEIDAAIVLNDGMAGGVVAALKGQGLDGKVPVTGQDADKAALNRVALGTQLVSVGKDARVLGAAAGKAAVELCAGTALADVTGAVQFETPEKKINDELDLPRARAHHPGQPPDGHRQRMGHQGRALQGRARRVRRRPARDQPQRGQSSRPAPHVSEQGASPSRAVRDPLDEPEHRRRRP